MTTAQPNRRLVRWLLGSALGLCLLLVTFLVLWFWLPVWAPGFVIRNSPWVEPVVRARAHWDGDDWSTHPDSRFCAWGPSAYPTLSRLLHGGPQLRQAALASYQLTVPYCSVSTSLAMPRDWERVVVNVNTIHEDGRQWWIARINNRDFEMPDGDPHQLAAMAPIFDRMRERAEKAPHPRMPGRQLAKIVLEMRCDRLVPYRIVDVLLRMALNGPSPDSALIASLHLTVRRNEDTTTGHEERAIRLRLMPADDAWPITLTTAVAGDPSSALTIAFGDQRQAVVTGTVDGKERRDAITKAFGNALPGKMRVSAVSVRGSADCRWADVVTAVIAAAALSQESTERDRSGAEEPYPIGAVSLSLMPEDR